MARTGQDTLKARKTLNVGGKSYDYFSLKAAEAKFGDISKLPFTLKVLLENMLRFEDDRSVTVKDVQAVIEWQKNKKSDAEIAYRPARVLMQDFTGVPAVVDLAAMREATATLGGDPQKINPLCAVDLVIDHSVMVNEFGSPVAFQNNVIEEFKQNIERYQFLRWGQKAFNNFRVVPPGTGICHQVNLEYLAQTVWVEKDQNGKEVAFPDTLVGTDSHTTMVNGLAVLGWGVGGIEAEAAMLGQPVSMLIPEVIGFKITGKMKEGTTATDLVLVVTQMLRKKGVVNKFVEFYGDGLDNMSLADRATIANMAPEYGATCGFFPIDEETIRYLKFTGRDEARCALVEAYAKEQGMWREKGHEPVFTDTLALDLSEVEPSIAGPKRPQDRILLKDAAPDFAKLEVSGKSIPVEGTDYALEDGAVTIAAITSCTNTSNPSVMVAAGLVAKKAHALGLTRKPWVKTSLAPGSQVVTDYLEKADLQKDLDAIGFNLVGYGCTTCIGNSGPLPENIANAVVAGDLTVAGVLSGNRNFEGRINPHVKANYLASPPLVVAYAIAGSMKINLFTDAIGKDKNGKDVFLKDIWPTNQEVTDMVAKCLTPDMFKSRYSNVFLGPKEWQDIKGNASSETYSWDNKSTYVQNPPYFEGMTAKAGGKISNVKGAKLMALFGDSITTDHISPAGSIKKDSPAGKYLIANGVAPIDFNSYGARRGNHEVMMRGTFANIRIKNELLGGKEGGFTRYKGEEMPIYDACMKYQEDGTPLVVIAGKEYGTGSSRDWAAKGTTLLGVKAVIAESFERIHRSNLVGMGVVPLVFKDGMTRADLKLTGEETFDVSGLEGDLKPLSDVTLTITRPDGKKDEIKLLCRIDTADEIDYMKNGGILHYVLRDLVSAKSAAA
ncbi:MAG: aconitate hydratase AcnA [Micavibrio aeruginosavorus]|uniref:Aconitate hydratase n=1 Tax=Micavibrio aeruginosavorus TaxID=349221 RepID=A0A2W5N1I0_9BACT|nr:MAG: aconitate hydratase AcnA [Micavibrio aeruginosavorus]